MTNQNARGDERRRDATEQVALRTGLLRRCPVHDEVFDPGQHDFQGAYMTAAFLVNQSDPLVAAFGGDRVALNGFLKTICAAYAQACPQCARAGAGPNL